MNSGQHMPAMSFSGQLRASRSDIDPRVPPLKPMGGGWSNRCRHEGADRWASFTRKKLELNTKSPPELKAISQSANLSISSGCGGLFRAASIRVELAAVALMNVRCWGKSGRHCSAGAFQLLDPKRPLGAGVSGGPSIRI